LCLHAQVRSFSEDLQAVGEPSHLKPGLQHRLQFRQARGYDHNIQIKAHQGFGIRIDGLPANHAEGHVGRPQSFEEAIQKVAFVMGDTPLEFFCSHGQQTC
jgi:hypothetical protein